MTARSQQVEKMLQGFEVLHQHGELPRDQEPEEEVSDTQLLGMGQEHPAGPRPGGFGVTVACTWGQSPA